MVISTKLVDLNMLKNSRFKIEELNTDVGANTIWLGANSIKLSLCGAKSVGANSPWGETGSYPFKSNKTPETIASKFCIVQKASRCRDRSFVCYFAFANIQFLACLPTCSIDKTRSINKNRSINP